MFERYTEKARRVIFFARYEASQLSSPYIETEHLLLGLLREDKALTNRFLRSYASVESIRRQVENQTTVRQEVSTSVDLPLSNESKRVLRYAAEEAERLGHMQIGTEHLLLGLLREEECFAAQVLKERGLRLSAVREQLARNRNDSKAVESGQRYHHIHARWRRHPGRRRILGTHTGSSITRGGRANRHYYEGGPQTPATSIRVLPGSKQTIAAELEQVSANP